jgi:hypothetical protein
MTPEEKVRDYAARHGLLAVDVEFVLSVMREAVAREREACACVADAVRDVYNISFCIASDIRARGKP